MSNTERSGPPSDAQINANRESARKSTGPSTAAGKAASSSNRLTHGLHDHADNIARAFDAGCISHDRQLKAFPAARNTRIPECP
ncbi:MAG TPA: hypothetical protein VMQ86_10830 [Bryobacteraceae bacterium]|jgi:hypothetical protein|nr:hypothetical protein [Bryobacteraceae bacterium]